MWSRKFFFSKYEVFKFINRPKVPEKNLCYNELQTIEKDICNFRCEFFFDIDGQESILIFTKNDIKFINFNSLNLQSNFPKLFQNIKTKKIMHFDRLQRKIFYLTKEGIFIMHYNTLKSINSEKIETFIRDSSIKNFIMDSYKMNIFYNNINAVILINIKSKIRKTIYNNTNVIIYFLKLNSQSR